jgi:8-oxo-dGTP diphosphatase
MERVLSTHSVKAVITNEQGDILFLQRDGSRRADMKSSWDLPGGLVGEGEDDKLALMREIDEELQRKVTLGRVLGHWTFFRLYDGATVEVTNYEAKLDTTEINDLTLSKEHVAAKWVPRNSLADIEVKDDSIFAALGENAK